MLFCSKCGQRLGESCTICPSCKTSVTDAINKPLNPYDAEKYTKSYTIRRARFGKPVLSIILIVINLIIWGAINLFPKYNISGFLMMDGGRVLSGEYWRLITSVFTHQQVYHVLANCYALYVYGEIVENYYGRKRFISIYLISGIVANLFSFALINNPSLGASGAVFGLLGAALALYLNSPLEIGSAMLKNIILCTVLTFIYSFRGGINNVAHFGGLFCGFLIGGILLKRRSRRWFLNPALLSVLLILSISYGVYGGMNNKVNILSSNYYSMAHSYVSGDFNASENKAVKITNDPNQYYDFITEAYAVYSFCLYERGQTQDAKTNLSKVALNVTTRGLPISYTNYKPYLDALEKAGPDGDIFDKMREIINQQLQSRPQDLWDQQLFSFLK